MCQCNECMEIYVKLNTHFEFWCVLKLSIISSLHETYRLNTCIAWMKSVAFVGECC